MRVAGLVLAAGEGRRFGAPKALLTHDGERFIDRATALLRDADCEPVVVVAGAVALDVHDALVVHNDEWASGMGSSLRAGLAAMPQDADAVAIVLVDQPEIEPAAVRRVSAAIERGAGVAIATYGGKRGHPVIIRRSCWAAVARLATGDEAARAFMRAYPEEVVEVSCDGLGSAEDVDTPEDLEILSRRPR